MKIKDLIIRTLLKHNKKLDFEEVNNEIRSKIDNKTERYRASKLLKGYYE